MNDNVLNAALRAFVVLSHADPEPPTDESIADDVVHLRAMCRVVVTPIDDPMSSAIHAFRINFYDECDVTMIVFVNDHDAITDAMISTDHQPFVTLPM